MPTSSAAARVVRQWDVSQVSATTLPDQMAVQVQALKTTVDNYRELISGMDKIVENKLLSTATGQSKTQGILSSLRKPQTYLGLCAIIKPLELLEQLSLTLQGEEVDIDSTEQAIRTVEGTIKSIETLSPKHVSRR